MNSYVISLSSEKERRSHIINEFHKCKVNFEFFDAYSPSEKMDSVILELIPELGKNTSLTQGEKGCFLSHFALWKRCVDEKLDYIAIFEDDVLLSLDLQRFFDNIKDIPSSCFILKLESFPMKVQIKMVTKFLDRNIVSIKSPYVGAAGYVLSNEAARKLIDYVITLEAEELLPGDELLFNTLINQKWLDIYQILPALCIQDRFFYRSKTILGSSLENERAKKVIAKDRNKTFWSRVVKQLKRTFDTRKRIEYR